MNLLLIMLYLKGETKKYSVNAICSENTFRQTCLQIYLSTKSAPEIYIGGGKREESCSRCLLKSVMVYKQKQSRYYFVQQ